MPSQTNEQSLEAIKFNSKDKFQRRYICTKKDGGNFIIESIEPIIQSQFSMDLVALNIDAAINTDMGSWDEGCYKCFLNKRFSIYLIKY